MKQKPRINKFYAPFQQQQHNDQLSGCCCERHDPKRGQSLLALVCNCKYVLLAICIGLLLQLRRDDDVKNKFEKKLTKLTVKQIQIQNYSAERKCSIAFTSHSFSIKFEQKELPK